MNGKVAEETLYDIDGNEVSSFSNDTKEGFRLWEDPLSMGGWEDTYPLSYVRSTDGNESRISASPTLFYVGTIGANWEIQGSADHYHFLAHSALAGGTWVWSSLDSCEALPTTIDDATLSISWQLSKDGGDTWMDVGASENHLYVTGVPATGALETVLDVGCSAAKGEAPVDAAGKAGVRDKIWEKFHSLYIMRVDYTTLAYVVNTATTAAGMLASVSGNGECDAWTDFLRPVLMVQGVSSQIVRVTTNEPAKHDWFRMCIGDVQGCHTDYYTALGFQYHELIYLEGDSAAIYDPSYGTRTEADEDNSEAALWERDYVEKLRVTGHSTEWDPNIWDKVELQFNPM